LYELYGLTEEEIKIVEGVEIEIIQPHPNPSPCKGEGLGVR
jgi:hypothetical protein